MHQPHWERLDRKTIYSTKFLTLFEDTIKLPNGKILDDYTVVKKPDGVIIVATDTDNKLLVLEEYKYAIDDYLLGLPAGHMEPEQSPIENAKRELIEETGYQSEDFEQIGILYDYASKDMHKNYIFRVKNAVKRSKTTHEDSEIISLQLLDITTVKQQIRDNIWKSSEKIAALALSGLLD
jgi:8-oxo-dGTP pyrophosphatase MutT (NUDIX family)